MIYIVTALQAEAQPFIEKYKLKKEKIANYKIFTNETIKLIISGMGEVNARLATQALINYFDITDDDVYINVGICGASKKYDIGELIEISNIIFNDKTYQLNKREKKTIVCVNEPIDKPLYDIVDMESFGFFDSVSHSPAIKNSFIFKVVSDHFEPQSVTKDGVKGLIRQHLDEIMTF